MAAKKRKAFRVVPGKLLGQREYWEVRILATAEGWAMVRRPGAIPFVCRESELITDPDHVAAIENDSLVART